MTLVDAIDVVKEYPSGRVLDHVSLSVRSGDRIGLLGRNGEGKTTLLKILAGELQPDSGQIARSRGIRIAYLKQEAVASSDATLMDEMLAAFPELERIHSEMAALESTLAEQPSPKTLHEYGDLQHEYERRGGYTLESEIKIGLRALGFAEAQLNMPISALSGGERNRVALAKVILSDADLLLLDEPTNHLDIEGTEYLERFLAQTKSGFILVTHDRRLLDAAVIEIAEIDRGALHRYAGNYTAYRKAKEKERQLQVKAHKHQKEWIERQEDFIRRNIAGQKTRQAQARRKMLGKLERIEAPPSEKHSMKLNLGTVPRCGRVVVRVDGVSKSYGERQLFKDVSLHLTRGDKVGLIGPNGCGKSTLLDIILGEAQPDSGQVETGHNVMPLYFRQKRRGLDPRVTVIDYIWEGSPLSEAGEIRSYLARFLVTGDDVFRRLGSFSGGEQSRIALARLLMEDSNLLVLDEPTNHLDIPSREVLENALSEYGGTVIVVSHDRHFLDTFVNRIWYFDGTAIRECLGSYKDYARSKATETQARPAGKKPRSPKTPKEPRKRRTKAPFAIEKEIGQVERELKAVLEELEATDPTDWGELARLEELRTELEDKAQRLYDAWEESMLEREA